MQNLVNIGALDFKMSVKHVHDIYERACKFGGKARGFNVVT